VFYGRERELEKLNSMYGSNKFEFAVFYGRRRVGKTTLIREFCKGKNAIYFVSYVIQTGIVLTIFVFELILYRL
jgi:hypothetical protein